MYTSVNAFGVPLSTGTSLSTDIPEAVYAPDYIEKMSKKLEELGLPTDQYTAPFVNAVNLIPFVLKTIHELLSMIERKNVSGCVFRAHFLRAITPYANKIADDLKAVEHLTKLETATQWIQLFEKSEVSKTAKPIKFNIVDVLFPPEPPKRVETTPAPVSAWAKPVEDNFVLPLIVRIDAPEKMPEDLERSYWPCFGQMFCLILFNDNKTKVYRPCWEYKPTLDSLLNMFDGRCSTLCSGHSTGLNCTFIHPVVEKKAAKVQAQDTCCDGFVVPRDYKTAICTNKTPHNAVTCKFCHKIDAPNTYLQVGDELVHPSKMRKNAGFKYLVEGKNKNIIREFLLPCFHGDSCKKGHLCTFAHYI